MLQILNVSACPQKVFRQQAELGWSWSGLYLGTQGLLGLGCQQKDNYIVQIYPDCMLADGL
jgi:hypothetical protein